MAERKDVPSPLERLILKVNRCANGLHDPNQSVEERTPSHQQTHLEPMRAELMPFYKRVLRHKGHCQNRIRELIQEIEGFDKWMGRKKKLPPVLRAPLPYCAAGPRRPDDGDLRWRYLCLGRVLERVFNNFYAFIPRDVEKTIANLKRYFEHSFWCYVEDVLLSEGFEAIEPIWLEIQHDLPTEDPDADPGSARKKRGQPPIGWDSKQGKKRRALVTAWKENDRKFRNKATFCEDEGVTVAYLKQAQDWVRVQPQCE